MEAVICFGQAIPFLWPGFVFQGSRGPKLRTNHCISSQAAPIPSTRRMPSAALPELSDPTFGKHSQPLILKISPEGEIATSLSKGCRRCQRRWTMNHLWLRVEQPPFSQASWGLSLPVQCPPFPAHHQ